VTCAEQGKIADKKNIFMNRNKNKKNGKQEQHFSSVVTNHSSVVICPEQNKNKRQEQHFSSVLTSIVTCLGQRQQPRTSPRRDQFYLASKCIISTKQ
jgi:hypothetical protein